MDNASAVGNAGAWPSAVSAYDHYRATRQQIVMYVISNYGVEDAESVIETTKRLVSYIETGE